MEKKMDEEANKETGKTLPVEDPNPVLGQLSPRKRHGK